MDAVEDSEVETYDVTPASAQALRHPRGIITREHVEPIVDSHNEFSATVYLYLNSN